MDKNRLKGEIIARFGSQKAYCKAKGWSENKLSRIFNDKYIPNINEVAEFAKDLTLSPALFIDIFLPNLSPNGDKSAL